MDIDTIKNKCEQLGAELRDALSRMELTDRVFTIKKEIRDLQKMCPHNNGNYDFSDTDECPYCGKRFKG